MAPKLEASVPTPAPKMKVMKKKITQPKKTMKAMKAAKAADKREG